MIELIFRRWPLKLLAAAISVAIWLAVVGDQEVVQDFRVPLEILLRQDAILEERAPTTVDVRLRGAQAVLREIAPFDLEMRVDLRNADLGAHSVQIPAESLAGLPSGVAVVLVDPARLSVVLAERVRKAVPVAPEFFGSPPDGYAFYWAETSPETAEIEGPASKVVMVRALHTDPIPLEGRTAPFVQRVAAVPESADVRLLDPRPITVRAHVDVAPVEVTFDGIPVTFTGSPGAVSAVPSLLSVTIAGPPALVARIRPAQIRAVADLSGLEPRQAPHDVPVRIEFLDLPLSELARITARTTSRSAVAVRIPDRRTRS